jgi:ribonuclease HII
MNMNKTLGIDEVGRGPWAGPLVVGAVLLGDTVIEGLTDSKKLSRTKRELLAAQIIERAAAHGIGWVEPAEIDDLGLSEALKLATRRAVEQITVPYHEIIIDGTINFLAETGKGPYVTTMKKADLLIASVSAASIIAKVARDDYMAEQGELYPQYGFKNHVGYGTANHRKAIEKHGVTPLHRRSFAPIAAILGDTPMPKVPKQQSNKRTGDEAETAVAEWLGVNGFEIIHRNWKTKFCEIDIIAAKQGRYYFIEVKHRKQSGQGGGVAAITPRKLRQMRFAAEYYRKYAGILDVDAVLAVVTTHSMPITIDGLLEIS